MKKNAINIKRILRCKDGGTGGRAGGVENQRSSRKHKKLDREDIRITCRVAENYHFWFVLIESAS